DSFFQQPIPFDAGLPSRQIERMLRQPKDLRGAIFAVHQIRLLNTAKELYPPPGLLRRSLERSIYTTLAHHRTPAFYLAAQDADPAWQPRTLDSWLNETRLLAR